jgi:regulation of enolase protein 1 (concanavalin A-like superfamily)
MNTLFLSNHLTYLYTDKTFMLADSKDLYDMMKLSNFFTFTCICFFLISCGNPTTTSSPADFVDGVATALENGGEVDLTAFECTREPAAYSVDGQTLTVTTAPHTDLWQRTYYHFRNDNAPVFQIRTKEQYFSFVVKTDFTQSHQRFDQCGVVMYLDSDNWLKGSVEFENEEFQHLGSVATNNGYSDWATTAIPADVKTMWYRFSRRADDYCIECSTDGVNFSQMRICHMYAGADAIRFGVYACSPEGSSFTAVFTDMKITECMWKAHDGQQPDQE